MTKTGILFSALLRRVWNRQFWTFLFFLALSAGFWVFQSLGETYEQEFDVPLELRGVPAGVVFTSDLPSSVRVTLRDKGTALINYKYGDKLPHLVLDFSTYANGEGRVRVLSSELIRQLRGGLPQGTAVVALKPDTLVFYYNHGRSRRVPVRLSAPVSAAAGYSIAGVSLQPDSVTVLATNRVLDTLQAAYVDASDLQELVDNVRRKADFRKIPGAKFAPAQAVVKVGVDRLVEKTLVIPVTGVNLPEGVELRTFPAQVEVTFQVGMDRYRSMTADGFKVVVDYNQLPADGSTVCRVILAEMPPGASHPRLSAEEVEYVIENIRR